MIRKFTVLILALLSVVDTARAVEYVAFQPTSPVRISWNNSAWAGTYYDTFSHSSDGAWKSLSAGDVIKIHVTGVVGVADSDSKVGISIKAGPSWEWSTLPNELVTANLAEGIITVTVGAGNSTYGNTSTAVSWTADEMATYIKERGLVVSGIKYQMLDITVFTNAIINASQTYFTGQSKDLGTWTWENRVALLPWIYNLAKLKAGDVLKIGYTVYSTLKEGEDGQMQVTDGTTELGNIGNVSTAGATGTLSITLTDAIISQLNEGNTRIVGTHVYVNSFTLESGKYTYSDVALTNAATDMGTGWSNSIQIKDFITDYSSFSVGDVMAINYTTAETYATDTYGQIQLQYKWADTNNGGSVYASYSSIDANSSGVLYIPITSDLLTKLDEDNIQIKGQNVTIPVNGIQFIHYTDITPAGYRPVYIPSGGYATFYGANTCALPDGVEAYYVSSTDENKAILTSVSNIPANQGVILKGATGIYQLYTTTEDAASVTDNKLVGTTTRTQITDASNKYVLYDNNGTPEFRKITVNSYLDAYKCYLNTAAGARSLSLSFGGDDTTGIDVVPVEHKTIENDTYYNLQGQRVASPRKGLYIVNGKKVIVK